MLFIIYLSFLFLCSATGIFVGYYIRNTSFYLKLFAWFVFVTFINEITQKFFFHNYLHGFYNIYSLLEFTFLGYLLYQIVESESIKRFILLSQFIYMSASLVDIFFIRGINHFHTRTYLSGAFLLIFFSAYFLYELFFKSLNAQPIKEPSFWIALGILLFHSCSASFILAVDFLNQFLRIELKLLNIILLVINLLYYSLFTIAFLCVAFKSRNLQSVQS